MKPRLETKIRRNPRVAVFSRNHPEYLRSAAEVSSHHPEKLITFRASTSWKAVQTALKYRASLPVYFVPIGQENLVSYEATLHTVLLNPRQNDEDTKKLLAFCLPETSGEGLWEGEVNTLYVIRQCRKLSDPFPMTALVKVSDDEPISERYGYSYSVVYEYLGEREDEFEVHPEEVLDDRRYIEGAVKKVSVNSYERSRIARQKCIEQYGFDCVVCGINFGQTYGSIGEGFIHVHHLKSLIEIKAPYKVDPVRDLRPVCPNCHAMLHRRMPSYSIEELKLLLKEQGKRSD